MSIAADKIVCKMRIATDTIVCKMHIAADRIVLKVHIVADRIVCKMRIAANRIVFKMHIAADRIVCSLLRRSPWCLILRYLRAAAFCHNKTIQFYFMWDLGYVFKWHVWLINVIIF